MTKRKKLGAILLGAILALGVGAGIGAGRVETGKAAPTVATMTAGENGSAAKVNNKDAIKVGTSSKGGNMKITVGTGAVKLSFYAAAWNGVTGLSINLTGATAGTTSFALTANTGIANNSPFTLSGDESSYYFETTLSGITSSTDITLTTSVAKRFVIWSASYDTEAGGGTVDPDPATSVNVTAAGGVTTVEAESTLQLSASVLPTTADQTVTWSSNNTGVATVNSTTGLVTGVAPGNVTITAASSTAGINGTIALNVIPVPPGKKVIFPDNGSDSGAAFTTATMSTATNGLKDAINGDFITSTVSTNNVYPGATGFKYGSSSTPGKWRFTTAETVTKVEAVFKQYSSDTAQGKITSHESTEKTITSDNLTSETTLVLLGTSSKEFSVDVTGKRGYLISLHFSYAPAKVLESIEVTNQPSKNSYFVGDIFDGSGMVVKAHFDDDSSETITPVLPTTPLVEGQTSVQISYTFGGVTETANVPVTVSNRNLDGLAVHIVPTKMTYRVGEVFDPTGMVIVAVYDVGPNVYNYTNYTFSPTSSFTVEGENDVTIISTDDNTITTTLTVNVLEALAEGTYTITVNHTDYKDPMDVSGLDIDKSDSSMGDLVISDIDRIKLNANPYDDKTISIGRNKDEGGKFTITLPSGLIATAITFNDLKIDSDRTPKLIINDGVNFTLSENKDSETLYPYANTLDISTIDTSRIWTYSIEIKAVFTVAAAAESFGGLFLQKTDAECTKLAVTSTTWNEMKVIFENADANVKAAIKAGDPDVGGTSLERALARYVYIHGKYAYADYMGIVDPSGAKHIPFQMNDNNTIMLIVIVSLISVSVLGGVFYLRKKETN